MEWDSRVGDRSCDHVWILGIPPLHERSEPAEQREHEDHLAIEHKIRPFWDWARDIVYGSGSNGNHGRTVDTQET